METMQANITKAAKAVKVKNRAPADIQITAEQIILEARDRAVQAKPPPPKQHIADSEELAQHRQRSRKEFENKLRMQRGHIGVWLRYAKWEEEQKEIERARSIYERAISVDYKNSAVWLRYAEMEMRNKFINRARNVWDRAVTLLPRVDTLWYKYTYMEEMLGNVTGARILFERWMEWEPAEQAWLSFINLELRAGEVERARAIYERYIACHPNQKSYMKYAKWEDRNGQKALARRLYERAMEELRDDERDYQLLAAFAQFEIKCGEMDRARIILKFGIDNLPEKDSSELQKQLVIFEKQHGDKQGVEDVILTKRRGQYEDAVKANPLNYDAWFDYIRLEEQEGTMVTTRETYERAIANVPPVAEKRFWRRYVYLWINYALYEELVAQDVSRTRQVYAAALKTIPHKTFTSGKLWLLAAQFEIRQKDLAAARKLLGMSIGMCPKEKVFRGYISIEMQLGNIDRCRKLYEKYLSIWPFNVTGWTKFADLEKSVGESDRCRAILELAVSQPVLDMPESAWKAYIDFEIEMGELENAQRLYDRLLAKTQHVKVWMSYAAFEASVVGSLDGARKVYRRGYNHFKGLGAEGHESRALILDTWKAFEEGMMEDAHANGGDTAEIQLGLDEVSKLMPKRVIKRRPVFAADGTTEVGSEEYYDYIFPDDETKPSTLKLLELAQKWKKAGGDVSAVLQAADGPAAGSKRAAPSRDEDSVEEDGRPPSKLARVQQTTYGEEGDAADLATEHEKELEDSVRIANSGTIPRDLYTEEDEGDAADRD